MCNKFTRNKSYLLINQIRFIIERGGGEERKKIMERFGWYKHISAKYYCGIISLK